MNVVRQFNYVRDVSRSADGLPCIPRQIDRIFLDYYVMKSYISQLSSGPMRHRLLGTLTETAIDTGGFMAYGIFSAWMLSMAS